MSRWSVRVRTAVVAAGVFGVVAAAAAFVGVGLLRSSLIDEIDRSNLLRAQDVVIQAFDEEVLPFLGTGLDADSTAALVAGDGTVLSTTDLDDGAVLVTYFDRPDEAFDISLPDLVDVEGSESMRGVVSLIDDDFGETYAFVASSTASVDRTVSATVRALLIAIPALVALVGLLVWVMAGRALRPVERIRAEVEEITGSDLHRRVPDPGTRGEIGALATTMNDMLERLQSSTERQRRFTADASHELRSPLASMAAQLDVDLAHPDTASWPTTAAGLRAETKRMQTLVDDLLVLARSDAGEHASVDRVVALDDLVTEAVAQITVRPGVSVRVGTVERVDVTGDDGQLRRLIDNLLTNALRHADGTVDVSLVQHDGTVRLVVDDDGQGIDSADHERIFERFVRLDDARARDGGGSGLGLALCHEICRRHGGEIDITESPEGGARFTAVLPAGR